MKKKLKTVRESIINKVIFLACHLDGEGMPCCERVFKCLHLFSCIYLCIYILNTIDNSIVYIFDIYIRIMYPTWHTDEYYNTHTRQHSSCQTRINTTTFCFAGERLYSNAITHLFFGLVYNVFKIYNSLLSFLYLKFNGLSGSV